MQLVEEHHRAVQIAPYVNLVALAARLLGGHVRRRADEGAHTRRVHARPLALGALGHGQRPLGAGGGVPLRRDRLGDAPVHEHHLPEPAHHDVGRLDVAVHHALGMGVLERVQEAEEELDPHLGGVLREVGRIARGELLDDRLERLPLDVLHHEEVAPQLVHPHVVDGHDVRVLEAADGADLVHEARERRRAGDVGQEALDGDLPVDVVVLDQDHLAHPARAEELRRLVAAPLLERELDDRAVAVDLGQDGGPRRRGRRGERGHALGRWGGMGGSEGGGSRALREGGGEVASVVGHGSTPGYRRTGEPVRESRGGYVEMSRRNTSGVTGSSPAAPFRGGRGRRRVGAGARTSPRRAGRRAGPARRPASPRASGGTGGKAGRPGGGTGPGAPSRRAGPRRPARPRSGAGRSCTGSNVILEHLPQAVPAPVKEHPQMSRADPEGVTSLLAIHALDVHEEEGEALPLREGDERPIHRTQLLPRGHDALDVLRRGSVRQNRRRRRPRRGGRPGAAGGR